MIIVLGGNYCKYDKNAGVGCAFGAGMGYVGGNCNTNGKKKEGEKKKGGEIK